MVYPATFEIIDFPEWRPVYFGSASCRALVDAEFQGLAVHDFNFEFSIYDFLEFGRPRVAHDVGKTLFARGGRVFA
jgi:hypothetical protein